MKLKAERREEIEQERYLWGSHTFQGSHNIPSAEVFNWVFLHLIKFPFLTPKWLSLVLSWRPNLFTYVKHFEQNSVVSTEHRHPLVDIHCHGKSCGISHSVLEVLCHTYLPQAHVLASVGHLRDHWISVFRQLHPILRYIVVMGSTENDKQFLKVTHISSRLNHLLQMSVLLPQFYISLNN